MTYSQHKQDLFVLASLDGKTNGYFVEFGATDGIHISNTYLLEKDYGWTGIVAEPCKAWHEALLQNRKCHVDTRCVWKESGQILVFNETENKDLSCIDQYSDHDMWAKSRQDGNRYEVETVSLNDLLAAYNAPDEIDYLSIDTEGSEYEILSAFNFDKYKIKVITCEHNNTIMKPLIDDLLTSKGYRRQPAIVDNEDWFILE